MRLVIILIVALLVGFFVTHIVVEWDLSTGGKESRPFLYFAAGIWVVPIVSAITFSILALIFGPRGSGSGWSPDREKSVPELLQEISKKLDRLD